MKELKTTILLGCVTLILPALVVSCEKQVEGKPEVSSSSEAPEVGEPQKKVLIPDVPEVEKRELQLVGDETAPVDESLVEGEAESKPNDKEPFVLKSLSDIKLHPGARGPKVGDKIYTLKNVPYKECGEYWILESNGYVSQLAVCSGDHAEGEGH